MTPQPNPNSTSTPEDRIDEIQFIINRLRLTAETRTCLIGRPVTDRLEMPRGSTRQHPRRRATTDVYLLAA